MNDLSEYTSIRFNKIIFLSFFFSFILTLMPLPAEEYLFWLPNWVTIVLIFWLINKPDSVGIITAFILGLFIDVIFAVELGTFALAYILSAFILISNQQRISFYSYGGQSLVVLSIMLGILAIASLSSYLHKGYFLDWINFISPFTAAFLWPIFNKLMIYIFNRNESS